MSARGKEMAMLVILLATCETSLQAFRAADSLIDKQLVADLETMVDRTRKEIEALAA